MNFTGILKLRAVFPSLLIITVAVLGSSCIEHRTDPQTVFGQQDSLHPEIFFPFNGDIINKGNQTESIKVDQNNLSWKEGIEGQGAGFGSEDGSESSLLEVGDLPLNTEDDFTVQFWVKTTMDATKKMVFVSHKDVPSASLKSQKNPGWVFYGSGGTWAWNMGSGDRRITYERSNGEHMPLNDGAWHQLSISYDGGLSQVRLYYDGENKAIYNVSDDDGFDFANTLPLRVGSPKRSTDLQAREYGLINEGADSLQALVNEFDRLCSKYDLANVQAEEFESLIVEPKKLFKRKADQQGTQSIKNVDFIGVEALEDRLMDNPYTVHQVKDFMEVAPLLQLYSLLDGEVVINEKLAQEKASEVKLGSPNFTIDNLAIWKRALSGDEIQKTYNAYADSEDADLQQNISSLTVGVWNIHHSGIHATKEKDGWDSRQRIVEILKKEEIDVLMMQETYSSGDYIAAELGYHFATTIDWDYLNQGSNISVISRYPIEKQYVPQTAAFMNVGTKLALGKNQDIYVMSNWYGMRQFADVFNFHQSRFERSDSIPVIFGGDFNAVPHTDGGESPASQKLLKNGFTDAFRSAYPDVQQYPGHTHISGRRIDQLYYKGKALEHLSTEHISNWPTGFPSDHTLIKTQFKLNKQVD